MIELERVRVDGRAVFVLRMRAGENRIGVAWPGRFEEVLDAVEREAGTPLVTTGEGRFYSTGLDLEALGGARTSGGAAADGWAAVAGLERVLARLLAFPAPTVACVNGHAFAAGLMLALAHDVRLVRGDRGWMCLPEVDLRTGRPLTPGMQAFLEARLERPVLHEILVTGARLDGAAAVARRLAHAFLPERELLPAALARAASLAGRDPATLAALKRGLYAEALAALAAGRRET